MARNKEVTMIAARMCARSLYGRTAAVSAAGPAASRRRPSAPGRRRASRRNAGVPLRQRQPNGERRPLPFLAGDRNRAVVGLDDGLGDVEAEAEAAVVAAGDV